MGHDGGRTIALGAGLGLLVSIYNYFAPTGLLAPVSDVAGTPGALLAILATLILLVAGLVLAGSAANRALTTFLMLGSIVGIVGIALVAWLLESHVLVALMLISAIGWLIRAFSRRDYA